MRALDPWKLEMQPLVSCHLGDGNCTQFLWKSSHCSLFLSHVSLPHPSFKGSLPFSVRPIIIFSFCFRVLFPLHLLISENNLMHTNNFGLLRVSCIPVVSFTSLDRGPFAFTPQYLIAGVCCLALQKPTCIFILPYYDVGVSFESFWLPRSFGVFFFVVLSLWFFCL